MYAVDFDGRFSTEIHLRVHAPLLRQEKGLEGGPTITAIARSKDAECVMRSKAIAAIGQSVPKVLKRTKAALALPSVSRRLLQVMRRFEPIR